MRYHRWPEKRPVDDTPVRPMRKIRMKCAIIDSHNKVFTYRIIRGYPVYHFLYQIVPESK